MNHFDNIEELFQFTRRCCREVYFIMYVRLYVSSN